MILLGDCREQLAAYVADSFDACVTDPPYHLTQLSRGGSPRVLSDRGFMGKTWDGGGVAHDPDTWRAVLRVLKPGAHLVAFGGTRTYHRLACAVEDAGFEIRDQLIWLYGTGFPKSRNLGEGIGTALKPAHEPMVLARKPFAGTVAACLAEHGTGALSIDACRVPVDAESTEDLGRWPANVCHDGSDAVLAEFPESAGQQGDVKGTEPSSPASNCYGTFNRVAARPLRGDAGSAARFFYCAKAGRAERNAGLDGSGLWGGESEERDLLWSSGEQNPGSFQSPNTHRAARNAHPTVKPIDLMRWLVRLVTPRGGCVLDPFAGSGSTLIAAGLEGREYLGIELEQLHVEIARKRLAYWLSAAA